MDVDTRLSLPPGLFLSPGRPIGIAARFGAEFAAKFVAGIAARSAAKSAANVRSIQEALHDPLGQAELAKLNSHDVASCAITVQLSAQLGKIKANVVHSPMVRIARKWVAAQGPQHYLQAVDVTAVFVLVDKVLPSPSWAPLHIQTAYPKDYR
jgi:hypothetical protein